MRFSLAVVTEVGSRSVATEYGCRTVDYITRDDDNIPDDDIYNTRLTAKTTCIDWLVSIFGSSYQTIDVSHHPAEALELMPESLTESSVQAMNNIIQNKPAWLYNFLLVTCVLILHIAKVSIRRATKSGKSPYEALSSEPT